MANGFNDVVLPHLGDARRLAQWLLRNDADAEDAVQEASLRAFRYIHTFAGGNSRSWFLRIVRHVCWNSRSRVRPLPIDPFVIDEQHPSDPERPTDPETRLMRMDEVTLVDRALHHLPARSRRLLRLREFEGLSYREVARCAGVPIGTVMSGLSRARHALRGALERELRLR